jgi:pyruvate kinase
MKNCNLWATLPNLANMDAVEAVFCEPLITDVRFNTGSRSPMDIEETLVCLLDLAKKHNKRLWIDIKGRQLRIEQWADPRYDVITLNHKISVTYPAHIVLRNGEECEITRIKDGNQIFVKPVPKKCVGRGQSVNVLSKELQIDGYLTKNDEEYLKCCANIGCSNITASFVECYDDLKAILAIMPKANIISKIESIKGVDFISSSAPIPGLMAARDDLWIECGCDYHKMFAALQRIISVDPAAICASRIFTSLEFRPDIDWADFADLEMMYGMGYRKFMLCDNVCNYVFERAIEAWKAFIND